MAAAVVRGPWKSENEQASRELSASCWDVLLAEQDACDDPLARAMLDVLLGVPTPADLVAACDGWATFTFCCDWRHRSPAERSAALRGILARVRAVAVRA